MPPKTQSFAVALQERASPDNCVENLDVPSWPWAWKPPNWLISDPQTRLLNGARALKGTRLDVAPGDALATLPWVALPSILGSTRKVHFTFVDV